MEDETKFPPVEITSLTTAEGHPVTGHKAIWNPETGDTYAIASNKYKLVKHEDVLENIEDVLHTNGHLGPFKRTISLDRKGGRMRATYRFHETEVALRDKARAVDDLINPTIDVFNSYDLSWRHSVLLGVFRLVCSNGQVVGETFTKFRKRHMPDLYLDDVKDALSLGIAQVKQQAVAWEDWTTEKIEKPAVEKTIESLKLNKKETQLLLEEPEVSSKLSLDEWMILLDFGDSHKARVDEMTKWVFFNILTQFITHRVASTVRKVYLEDRVRKAFY